MRLLPMTMMMLGMPALLLLGPAAADDKLSCNAACKGPRVGSDYGCDGPGDRIDCVSPGNTVGGVKLGSVPDWTGVVHKDKKTTL